MQIETRELSPILWDDFAFYFEFRGECSGCWCMNHRLPMGLDFEGEPAKLAMQQLVESQRVYGVLAYVENDKTPVGWCSLDRRKTLPGHDCIGEEIACDATIWSIHCVTSRSDYKGKGVEEALIKGAIDLAKKRGATTIESYPEPKSQVGQSFKTWNTFNGYESLFVKLGFEPIKKDFGEQKEFYHPMIKHLS